MTAPWPDFAARFAGARVRFGAGARAFAAEEARAVGGARALVVATERGRTAAREIEAALGPMAAGLCARAAEHTPVEVTGAAMADLSASGADCIVSIGGGSAIGLGKALALRTGLPQVAIPTTLAGSEATAILGETEGGRKTTRTDPRIRPAAILYDPELLVGLPRDVTAASAMNAVAHAAEALYAKDRNPLTSALAREGMRQIAEALPRSISAPGDVAARGGTQLGAWLCGAALGQVGMALHHKLCHALGGAFGLPHAATHAAVLPHAVAFNEAAVPELLAPVAEIFGGKTAGAALRGFAERIGAPLSLRELGLREADLGRAAEAATANPYWNPRPVERGAIEALLRRAWAGETPAA